MREYVHPRLIDWELAMGDSKHHHGQKHPKDCPAQIVNTVAAVIEPFANTDGNDELDCEKPDQRRLPSEMVLVAGLLELP